MQGRLRESYLEMGDDNQALVSPVGEAFKYARIADSTINLYSPDNSHPSPAGTYLAACTFYATLYQTSPVGFAYNGGLTINQAVFLQQIAAQTVLDSLSTWNVNEFTPQASFTYNQTGSSPFNYQFNSTTNNAFSYEWYFGDGDSSTLSNPLHTYFGNGVYTVTLTVSNGCVSNTTEIQITISPFNAIKENYTSQINIWYQNQQIYIRSNQLSKTVTVYNALGKQVYQNSNIIYQSETINTTGWSKGIYFVQCNNNNQNITKKIVLP